MSFTCEGCNTPQKAKTTPIKVTREEREVTYKVVRRDSEGELVPGASQGREIRKELSLCYKCAEVPEPKSETIIPHSIAGFGLTKIILPKDHRHRCKELVEDCKVCLGYVRQAFGLPLHLLSLATENQQSTSFHTSFASVAFASMQDNTRSNTRRGAEDVKATYAIMGPFAKRGGRL